MRVKSYFIKDLKTGIESKSDFYKFHFFKQVDFTDEGVILADAQEKIYRWNKIDRDEKHNYEYRLDVKEEKEIIIEKPMKFKTYHVRCSNGQAEERSFNLENFVVAGIPYDDEGMHFEYAFYMINRWNSNFD